MHLIVRTQYPSAPPNSACAVTHTCMMYHVRHVCYQKDRSALPMASASLTLIAIIAPVAAPMDTPHMMAYVKVME